MDKIGHIVIITHLVFPICCFLLYLYNIMLVNVNLNSNECKKNIF